MPIYSMYYNLLCGQALQICIFQKGVEEQLKQKQEEQERLAIEQEERRRQQYEEENRRRRELQEDGPRIKDVSSVHDPPKYTFEDSPPE